jgi:two-component sensor histidine kinase
VPSPIVEDSLLVVSELVGNAVQHAQPPMAGVPGRIGLRWRVVDRHVVRTHVTHAGAANGPQLRSPSPSETTGRGLVIVNAVASDWGVSADESEVTVHAIIGRQAENPYPDRHRQHQRRPPR